LQALPRGATIKGMSMKAKILASAGALLTGLARVLGGDGFEAPVIEKATPWLAMGISVVAVLAIAVVAFKTSRRTHLD
jgi:hypothetical protein